MARACPRAWREPGNELLQPGLPLAARGAYGGVQSEGARGLCRSVPTTSPMFWQPHRGQVALLLPFPGPTFAGTWQYGQPACPGSPRGAAPQLCFPAIPPASPSPSLSPRSAQAPVMPARGKAPAPPAMAEPCPAGGVPQDPAGPPGAGLGGCHPCRAAPAGSPWAGRQAVPRAALTGRFVLCRPPGGETKGAVRRGRCIVPAAMR